MRFDDSAFSTEKAIHAYLAKHGDKVIALKRASVKHADAFAGYETGSVQKAIAIESPSDIIQVKAVINTTNLYDSHGDVHIDGIWTKSLKENRFIQHLQEHGTRFADVISEGEDLKAYVKTTTFESLNSGYTGKTQALTFESNVDISVNAYMHGLYAKGRVNQHSVGMQYVKVLTAIDNKDYKEEYENWKKYVDLVANKSDIRNKYFFPVLEAKVIEGSAVTRGSNHVTPTMSVSEPKSFHSDEPAKIATRKNFILLHSR